MEIPTIIVIEASAQDGSVFKGPPAQGCQLRVHLPKGVTLTHLAG